MKDFLENTAMTVSLALFLWTHIAMGAGFHFAWEFYYIVFSCAVALLTYFVCFFAKILWKDEAYQTDGAERAKFTTLSYVCAPFIFCAIVVIAVLESKYVKKSQYRGYWIPTKENEAKYLKDILAGKLKCEDYEQQQATID